MPQVVAYEDIPPEKVIHNRGAGDDKPSADVYPLIGHPKDPHGANAFLVRYVPGTTSSTHYHTADQVQIIVEGRGHLGHHQVTPYQLHFSRAYTPYGPLIPHEGEGWAFINLRTRPDPEGAQRLSVARDKLLQVKGRRPFQTTCDVRFPVPGGRVPIEGLHNDEGLSGLALTLPPNGRTTAPSPAGSDGQYLVVTQGSLVWQGRTHTALAIAFVAADEEAFVVQAGPEGLQAMVVNFPRVGPAAVQEAPALQAEANELYKCVLCDFHYAESEGLPAEGITAGTRWQDVPPDWTCPDCGAAKADFEKVGF